MMKDSQFEEKTLKRQPIFKGVIIEVVVDDVLLPSGDKGTRELVLHNGAVGVLAITKEQRIVLVKQFRKPLEKVMLEIPAGKIERGEDDHLETAKRELEEETSYQAEKWQLLFSFATAPGFSNEVLHLYEASGLTLINNPLPQDDDELIELCFLTLAEAQAAIKSGMIYDAKTILAIQYWELQQIKRV